MQSATNCYTGGILYGYEMTRPAKDGGWKCDQCGEIFRTRKLFYTHRKEVHVENGRRNISVTYGDYACKFCGKNMHTTSTGIRLHEMRCLKNPERVLHDYSNQKTPEYRQKCSERQKLRHKLGLAKGFPNRSHMKHSYSELWVIGLLKNEYNMEENVHYRTEMPFHQFFLDFAWPDKRLCIEVDGNQHLMPERKAKDEMKDEMLRNEGWKILRIKWGFITTHKQETKEYIDTFLKESGDVSIPLYIPKRMLHKNPNMRKVRNDYTSKNVNNAPGVVTKLKPNGIYSTPGYSAVDWSARKDTLLTCGVDFSKHGSVVAAARVTGFPTVTIHKIIKKFPEAFPNKCHHAPCGMGKYSAHHKKRENLIDRRISEEEYLRRWNLIKGAGEDLTLWGWKKRVSRKIGLSTDIINATLLHFQSEYEAMFPGEPS